MRFERAALGCPRKTLPSKASPSGTPASASLPSSPAARTAASHPPTTSSTASASTLRQLRPSVESAGATQTASAASPRACSTSRSAPRIQRAMPISDLARHSTATVEDASRKESDSKIQPSRRSPRVR
jgi:hypothetical protein